ncbi:alternate-type signal peptide domain-containing protein [Nocardioides litoris]|uniref:alternate-type signal peptide domain-containing protein n=1 Tax=Nocardioides litoris TaxID=1926648 RepID=UPI00112144FC|nr:alternate-type signal peptide domain-containing protein [Nocardioides litoris]
MNKTAKGALAATAAAALLMGGAGSLAFWTDADTVNGGSFTSGDLDITAVGCDANWVYAPGNAKAGTTVTKFVPGDKITKNCTFTVTGSGDNLRAAVDLPGTIPVQGTEGTSFKVVNAASYKLSKGGVDKALLNGKEITSADNGSILTATIVSTFDFGSSEQGNPKVNANDMQKITRTVDGLKVSLTQVDPNAPVAP